MNERAGRTEQVKVYVGKFFRIFINERGWKIIVFAAVISGILAMVVGEEMFKIKESTRVGAFAIVSACVWIGIFNSIQDICRERAIIKREHRTGLHISAYVAAHMIFQAGICLIQSAVMLLIYNFFLDFPKTGIISGNFYVDLFITFFLMTYASDMLALAVSSIVKTPTTAMTIMPFLLIIQLIFSGAIFPLTGVVGKIADLTVSKWGMRAVCTEANINSLPSNLITSELMMFRDIEGADVILDLIPEEEIQKFSSEHTYEAIYEYKKEHVWHEWEILLGFILLYGLICIVNLEFIDRDKR